MNNVKKLLFTFGIVLILVAACSLSAFALDSPKDSYDFVLESYPMHTLDNSNNVQSYSYFIQNTDYEVLYCEVIINKNSGSRPIDFTNCYVTAGSLPVDNNYRFVPMAWLTQAFGGYGFQLPTKMFFYDESGDLVQEFTFNTGGSAAVGLYYNTNWFNNGSNIDRFSLMYDGLRFFAFPYPSTYSEANTQIMTHYTTGYPDYLLGGYNVVSPDEQFDSTIEGNIYVNGQLVYGSSGGGNLASKIIGSIGGTISTPDGNGGTTSSDINLDVDLDLPEYDGYIGTDEFPTMPEFDDSSLSVIDGGSALQWVYARVNDLVTSNQKIFALVTSCLSLGVIMLILNKRS